MALKAALILDYRVSANTGCNRPTTSTKNNWFPLQTLKLKGILGKYLAAKQLSALKKGIIVVVLMPPVSLLSSRSDVGHCRDGPRSFC